MMGSKKKDLEIIYNLQWKNKSGNGGDKANIIGMYDIPATTLNWEIFKSYLSKNSGTIDDDVKVSYITDSNREFPIESQTDFQIALYAFRRKARMGDIVNLKMERTSDPPQSHKSSRHSNDVETQFDTTEGASIVSSCCNSDTPPEWFIAYMAMFKKNLTEEISAAVSSAVANIKPYPLSQPSSYHSRKSKPENSKRRKLPLLTGDGPHESTKDILKSLKLEGKLEHKLEKLENKTKKLREKKMALFSKSSDSDGCSSSIKRRQTVTSENDNAMLIMDATPVNTQEMVPHMLGGEIYLHQWKVMNSGKLPWTNETLLMFTWGSKALKPLDPIVPVPHLKPGETGTAAVRLQIPNQPGQYECYFHFHHKDRRFGHWLGCQVIVDPFDLKGNKSVLDTAYMTPFESSSPKKVPSSTDGIYNIDPVVHYGDIWQGTTAAAESHLGSRYSLNLDGPISNQDEPKKSDLYVEQTSPGITMDKVVRDLSLRVEDIKLQDPTDTNCSSDSDNQSIISLTESNSSKGIPAEFVVVPIPDCFKIEDPLTTDCATVMKSDNLEKLQEPLSPVDIKKVKSIENFDDNNNEDVKENKENQVVKNDETASNSSHKSDIVMVTLSDGNQDTEEYACVIVDGQKIKIPKKMIKSEYLKTDETSENSTLQKQRPSGSSSPFAKVTTKCSDNEERTEHQIQIENNESKQESDLNFEDNDYASHCSAAGSCFSDVNAERNSRLFIFPQTCPGYEVIQGTDAEADEYTWSKSDTHYAFCAEESKEVLVPTISNPIPIATASNNPFTTETIQHVPNYQQTPPEDRNAPSGVEMQAKFQGKSENTQFPPQDPVRIIPPEKASHVDISTEPSAPAVERPESTGTPVVHILPEALVTGVSNAVSSVARSVINRIVPQGQPGNWVNGHWVSTNPDSPREANLQALAEMGFWNRDLNATLLARYNDDLSRVVGELVQ